MHQSAVEDLEAIWVLVFENDSKLAADTLYTEIISCVKKIQNDYTIGKSLESFRGGYWLMMVGEIRVFYRVDRDDCLEVVRVI